MSVRATLIDNYCTFPKSIHLDFWNGFARNYFGSIRAGVFIFQTQFHAHVPETRRLRAGLARLAMLSIADVSTWTVTASGAGRGIITLDAWWKR